MGGANSNICSGGITDDALAGRSCTIMALGTDRGASPALRRVFPRHCCGDRTLYRRVALGGSSCIGCDADESWYPRRHNLVVASGSVQIPIGHTGVVCVFTAEALIFGGLLLIRQMRPAVKEARS